MTPEQREAQARTRFFILTLLRLGGMAVVIVGLLIIAGRITAVPMIVGYALMLVGLVDVALVPLLLARRWRTPDA